ncbi:MAG: hypothetical protein ACI87O_002839 [Planctomycetota bacterium]|jgi:hypothetical protein
MNSSLISVQRACPLPVAFLILCACQSAVPNESPALIDMEEPLELFHEPMDEALRLDLPQRTFSGIELSNAPASLDSQFGGESAPGLEILGVVRNSPATLAHLEVGDLLLEAEYQEDGKTITRELQYASDWRAIELEQPAGSSIDLLLDRAGRESHTVLILAARNVPVERVAAARFREEQRSGIVMRTATEVEARAVGLAPGAGAVLVGLSAKSPWRPAGLRFGDIVTRVDTVAVAHPQVLLEALRSAPEDGSIEITYHRPATQMTHIATDIQPGFGAAMTVRIPVTHRVRALRELDVPLLFHYERGGHERSNWSALFGILQYKHTPAAWRFRLFWLIRMGVGDTEQLTEVGQ